MNERLRLLAERGRGRGRGRFGGPGRPPYDPAGPERRDAYAPGAHDRLGPGPIAADHPATPTGLGPGGRRSFEPHFDRHASHADSPGGRGSGEWGHAERGARPPRGGGARDARNEHDTAPSPRWAPGGEGAAAGDAPGGAGAERHAFLDRVRQPPPPAAPARRRVLSAVVVDGQQITASSTVRRAASAAPCDMQCSVW